MTMTRAVGAGLALLALSTAFAGCGQNQRRDDSGGSCVSALTFEGRRYVWIPTQNTYVKPGAALGTGTFEACFDGDDSDVGPSTERVFVLRDVSSEEAIVLTDGQGRHGVIYRADHEPEGGWDPDLQVWLNRTRAKSG
jgi:hypothetical protein